MDDVDKIQTLARVILKMDKLFSHDIVGENLGMCRPEWCHFFCEVSGLPIDEITKCCGVYLDLDVKTIKILNEEFKNYVQESKEEKTKENI